MSMSTHLVGIKPPDKKWKAMKAAYDACIEADIPVPEEVEKFFEYEVPDSKGVPIELSKQIGGVLAFGVTYFTEEGKSGYEVELDKLPEDIKILRFYNSW